VRLCARPVCAEQLLALCQRCECVALDHACRVTPSASSSLATLVSAHRHGFQLNVLIGIFGAERRMQFCRTARLTVQSALHREGLSPHIMVLQICGRRAARRSSRQAVSAEAKHAGGREAARKRNAGNTGQLVTLATLPPGGRMVKWLEEITVTPAESDNFYHFHDNRVLPPGIDQERAKAEGAPRVRAPTRRSSRSSR